MVKQICRRFARQSVFALAVALFAVVLSVVLCHLHRTAEAEMQSYQASYDAVPVFMKVTDLDGTRIKRFEGLEGWVIDLFTENGLQPNLSPYVSTIHLRCSIMGTYYVTDEAGVYVFDKYKRKVTEQRQLTGISSTYVAEELTEGWGGKIHWYEGYDESILATDEFVVLVPESLKDKPLDAPIEMDFLYGEKIGDHIVIDRKLSQKFQVVGYYEDPGNELIYCPYATIEYIHAFLHKPKNIEAMGAMLNDNDQLPALREAAAKWFAEPNPLGKKPPGAGLILRIISMLWTLTIPCCKIYLPT